VAERGRRPTGRPETRGGRRSRRWSSADRLTLRSARQVVSAASEVLGISTGRRAVVLVLVVCALALSVAVPLRNYIGQRQELAAVEADQRRLAAQVAELSQQRQRLADPAQVAAQARSRLGYVTPGETPYVVQLPEDVARAAAISKPQPKGQWYQQLWADVRGVDPAAP
jgi:cell division protein FtsB